MNWRHLRAFVWLRWRLLNNQWRRAGTVNAVLMMILIFGALAAAIPLFIGCFLLGLYAIPRATPAQLLYAWDGLIVGFLFFWGIGLVTELQRTEPLSLSKFLHLPVSANGAFLINYLSSLLRLTLIAFGPLMLGFGLALVVARGALLLPVLPALAAFVLMVSALTYQLQGWLASLMDNPRRRRTVIVAMTAVFVLIFQLPNLINVFAPWGPQRRAERSAALAKDMATLHRVAQSQKFDASELSRRQQEIVERYRLAEQQAHRELAERWGQIARNANLVLPIGWLPLGVMSAAEGRVLPSILGTLGMALIGTASLWRAYRTTVRQYRGQFTGRNGRPATATPAGARRRGTLLLEARLPGVSEPVSAIALGGFRSLLRAPEAKMMLLSGLIMVTVFGTVFLKGGSDSPEMIRPLVAIGGMVFVFFGLLQLMGNQFGFDRDGFRVFVLSSARRRDILLGKNLAFAPVALAMAAILLPIAQAVYPMRLDHLLAMFPQYVSMFLLLCIVTNLLSIYAPVHVAAGALKASNPRMTTVLLQLAMFLVLFPLTQGLTLLPLGIEALLRALGKTERAPVCLALTLAECAAVIVIYRVSLEWLGSQLQAREQRILESVTKE